MECVRFPIKRRIVDIVDSIIIKPFLLPTKCVYGQNIQHHQNLRSIIVSLPPRVQICETVQTNLKEMFIYVYASKVFILLFLHHTAKRFLLSTYRDKTEQTTKRFKQCNTIIHHTIIYLLIYYLRQYYKSLVCPTCIYSFFSQWKKR